MFGSEFSAPLLSSFRVTHFMHSGARGIRPGIALVNLAIGDGRARMGGENSRWWWNNW